MSFDLIQSISLLSCYFLLVLLLLVLVLLVLVLVLLLLVLLLLLLSLDAHNHVDDYYGTLGGVRKVHILALVTSHYN